MYNTEVQALKIDDSFKAFSTIDKSGDDPTTYDHVIMTSDLGSAQWIFNNTIGLYAKQSPKIADLLRKINESTLGRMRLAPDYKVLRIWFDKQLNRTQHHPNILETPDFEPINLVVQFDLLEDEYREWAAETGLFDILTKIFPYIMIINISELIFLS